VTDRCSKFVRSQMMARVREKNTAPEQAARNALRRLRIGFQVHRDDLPGTPDITLMRRRVAIFVHGCFWHGHAGCRYAAIPATRRRFYLR